MEHVAGFGNECRHTNRTAHLMGSPPGVDTRSDGFQRLSACRTVRSSTKQGKVPATDKRDGHPPRNLGFSLALSDP